MERAVRRVAGEIGKVAEENGFLVGYLLEGGGMAEGRKSAIEGGMNGLDGADGDDESDDDEELTVEQLMKGVGRKVEPVSSDEEDEEEEKDADEGEWMGMEEDE